ncbi:uncharacterized protein LOC110982977 isoform X2 [Acanthaster planci]|uniref:Uncharacterized protein LOC110982977 isoform X2 n=1 Tax=Acanthaster planci TaxID=133434 RepID=A0A8B7Z292_ACAPL|nr:uncharacterized protein LOC110982977 isoform X2 [Acanthaster planci]
MMGGCANSHRSWLVLLPILQSLVMVFDSQVFAQDPWYPTEETYTTFSIDLTSPYSDDPPSTTDGPYTTYSPDSMTSIHGDPLYTTDETYTPSSNDVTTPEFHDTDECASTPCQNGGTCADGVNGYTCTCVAGYEGVDCGTDTYECASNPCENGGNCADGVNGYTCTCVAGYEGADCSIDIHDCPYRCLNGGTCLDGVDFFRCECAAGFEGRNCSMNFDDCSSNPCLNGGTCTDSIDSFICDCAVGYGGMDCSPITMRLVQGDTPNEGNVEVTYGNQTGGMCSDNWRIEEANVVCRQLGYPSASQAWNSVYFGRGSEVILLGNVECQGNETNIDQCDHGEWLSPNCYYYQVVGVSCDVISPSPVLVRLVNGSTPYEGRVELYHRCFWGTVSDPDWTIEDANVICRQLGYLSAAEALPRAHFGEGSGYVILDFLICDGDEAGVDDCDRGNFFWSNYDHNYDVGVKCNTSTFLPVAVNLVNGSTPYEGRVEVYYAGQWGTISGNGWSIEDANVICRQLGLPSASRAWQNSEFGQGSVPILLHGVACNGSESNIEQCDHTGWLHQSYVTGEVAGVTCGEELGIKKAPQVPVRLVGGSTPYEGRVEVYGPCQWGTVNSNYWSIREANVVCRQLGYPSASQAWWYNHFGQGTGPLTLSGVSCHGNESGIQKCNHSEITSNVNYYNYHYYYYYYYYSNHVGVSCNPTSPLPTAVRLVDGNTPHEGRVEIYYKCQWSTICNYNDWDIVEANVVCRQLGYPSAANAWRRAQFGQGSGPIFLSNVECDGHEQTVDQCDHSGWLSHYCSNHYYDVGVTCNVSTAVSVVRLVNGSTPYEGRVEVYYAGQWGTICGNGWSIEDANVICRQLGYPPASKAWQNSEFGQGLGPVLLGGVACNGSESNIEQCNRSRWFNQSCSYGEDAGVTCGENYTNPAPSTTIRLVYGRTPNEGTVEVYHDCFWGTIYDPGWDIRDANVVCRQLGYPSASQARRYAYFGRGTGLVLLRNVDCVGNESSIETCRHSGWFFGYYNHYYDAGVTCNTAVNFTLPLQDNELPNITCPTNVTVQTHHGQNLATVTLPDVISASDNSGVVKITATLDGSQYYYYSSDVGDEVTLSLSRSPHLWHYTATDESYNRATCGMYIIIVDKEPPQINNCPDYVTLPILPSTDRVSYSWTPPTFLDNSDADVEVTHSCHGSSHLQCDQAGSGTFSAGVTVVMYKGRDKSGNENICQFSVTVTVAAVVCPPNITVLANPGSTSANINWLEPVLIGWVGPVNIMSNVSSGALFPIGTTAVNYKLSSTRFSLALECEFIVTVEAQCASETVGDLTWPAAPVGSVAESIERCPLMTMNAGEPLAVRNCSIAQAPVYFKWEEPEHRSCGEKRTDVTLEDVIVVEVTTGNVVEVAEFLANQTSESASGDAQDVEVVSDILMNIVQAGSGDTEVTKLVLETVNNVINEGVEPDAPDSARSSSEIVRSVETQVALTLQEEGKVSIRQETIHVEAVSLDPEENRDGFSFASVLKPGQGSSEEGSLVGTDVQTFDDDIPADVNVVASVQLPGSILDSIPTTDGNDSTPLQVSFLIYADDTLFQSSSIKRHQKETNSTRKVAGSVVSLTIENVKLVNLTEPLVLTFKAPDETDVDLNTTLCVFWDFDLEDGVGDWSTVGCTLSGLSSDVVSCDCDHATNFAILVDVKGQEIMNRALDIISQVGGALSIVALVVTLIIYLSIRKLRTGKSRQIFIHFCFSLLMLYVVFLAGVDNAKGGGCVFVAAFLHYLTLSTMMWMAVEARNMYVSTVKVFPEDTPRYMIKACLIAWGSPLLVLTVTLAAAVDHYKNELYCFLKPDLVLYIALLAPIALILLHNFITFILVMRSLLKVREVSRSQQISKRLQNAVGISVLMGLTWVFGFLAIDKATFAFQLIFCLTNSLQGVVVCIMFCIRREEVRTAIAPYLGRFLCCKMPSRPGVKQSYNLPEVSQSVTSPSSIHTAELDTSLSGM